MVGGADTVTIFARLLRFDSIFLDWFLLSEETNFFHELLNDPV
jgi:hypothetical protein